jgi:DNA-binding GntR family transcriptional regulator
MSDAAQEEDRSFARPDLLAERLSGWIRDEIVSGRMAPGERLVEQALAKRCNVSRVPLREALRMVASEGLLTLMPHRGAMVTMLSDQDLSELFDLRIALEGFAAAAVARRRPVPDLSGLRRLNDTMEGFVRAGDYDSYHGIAATFHAELVAAAGNALLIETYDRVKVRFRRYQAALSKIPELPPRSVAEHTAILDAMTRGDVTAARDLAEEHIRTLVDRYRESRG